jgi:hypothetical protein
MLATTHPAGPPFADGAPLFGFAGKRGKKLILNSNSLFPTKLKRDVEHSDDRVSLDLG